MKHSRERMPKTFRKGMVPFIVAMLALPVCWFIVFYVVVNFNSILLAFRSVAGVTETGNPLYVWGLKNFSDFFLEFRKPDSEIYWAIVNTLKYFALNVLLIMPLTYLIAYFLYKEVRGHKFFRVLFYMPAILSSVTMVILFKNFIGGYGPLDELWFALTGKRLPAFLTDHALATPAIMVYCVWVGFGVNMVLYQGAMKRIPTDVIEAGKLDGIRWYQELWFVVTPMVWPTLSTTILIAVTGLFNSGGPILLMTNGGFHSTTINFFIFNQIYRFGEYSYPSAVGLFFTVVSLPIVFGLRWLLNKLDRGVEY